MFIAFFTKARHWILPWAIKSQFKLYFCEIHFDNILPSTPKSIKLSLLFRFSDRCSVYISHCRHAWYISPLISSFYSVVFIFELLPTADFSSYLPPTHYYYSYYYYFIITNFNLIRHCKPVFPKQLPELSAHTSNLLARNLCCIAPVISNGTSLLQSLSVRYVTLRRACWPIHAGRQLSINAMGPHKTLSTLWSSV
jgi:hypothetical protein